MSRRSTSSLGTGKSWPVDNRKAMSHTNLQSSRPLSTVSNRNAGNSSVLLNNWITRSASAPALPNRQLASRNGRANKASTLRLQACPSSYVQPNYREIIKNRKDFAQRRKSLSASAVKCSELPNGESLHAFITGARYNRAHHLDSQSLNRFGLYIPRSDASRSFINMPGTPPQSPSRNGSNKKATRNMSDSHFMQPMSSTRLTSQLYVQGEPILRKDSQDTLSLDQEVNIVFGPSHTSSSSGSSSETDLQQRVTPLSNSKVTQVKYDIETSYTSSTSVTPSHKDIEVEKDSPNLTDLDVKHLKEDESNGNTDKKTNQRELEFEVVKEGSEVLESEHDFISVEAIKLTADILQQSNSSSSLVSSDTTHTVSSQKESIRTTSETNKIEVSSRISSHNEKDNASTNDLASKSSTIFVDMSNLMEQEKSVADCEHSEDIDVAD